VLIALAWSLTILAFAAAPHYAIALVALFVAGMLSISFTSMAQALVQLEAPAERRGRIIGLFNVSINGMRTGSGLTVGFLGALIGIHWSLGLCATLLALLLVPLALYVKAGRPGHAAAVAPVTAAAEHLGGCC
jgi:MFS family permease